MSNARDGGDLREDAAPCIKLDLNIVGGINLRAAQCEIVIHYIGISNKLVYGFTVCVTEAELPLIFEFPS